jgi:2,4-didehydro-3-deoxy-L-rhamnonate hydrolase
MTILSRRMVLAAPAVVVAMGAGGYALATRLREPPVRALFAERLDPQSLAGGAIAAPDEALTFARSAGRVLRVERHEADRVVAVDLTDWSGGLSDPIMMLARFGEAAIRQADGPRRDVATAELGLPFDAPDAHIGLGANYPAHGAEVAVERPFVFPKASAPTPASAPVSAGPGLLDHEVELGIVTLAPVRPGERPARVGLALVGDYTDRATLLRELVIGDVESGHGFGSAKSRPGYLPVGPFLVVPRDPRAFLRELRLDLFVDGALRQVARPRLLTWDLDRMLDEIFARSATEWRVHGRPMRLPTVEGAIPAATIVLSGTPDGVIFRPPSARQIGIGAVAALAGLQRPTSANMFEPAIREAVEARSYLQPGQSVVMRADKLGVIRHTIVA